MSTTPLDALKAELSKIEERLQDTKGATKLCPECNEIKELSKFHVDRHRSDGHSHKCAECTNRLEREKNAYKRLLLERKKAKTIKRKLKMIDPKVVADQEARPKAPRKEVNRLSIKESWLLCNFIVDKYAASVMNDQDFAKLASQELGFEVDAAMLGTRRRELEIPAFNKPELELSKNEVLARLQKMEAHMNLLEARLNNLVARRTE